MSMVTPEISQVLTQMRVLQAQAQSSVAQPPADVQPTSSFSDILNQSINSVNDVQKESGRLKTAFEMGDPNVGITEVMIASQKSGLAFGAMVEVRNKLLDAYKEVMRMQV